MEGKKRYLAPVSSKSVVQIIIDRLTGAIIEGELKPGDKIPTEPELAEELQVGRNSVREAIRILVAYGVLEIRRPEGTFVCNGFSTQIINPMIYQVILQKEGSYDDLIGLRKIIENGIMTLLMEQRMSAESYKAISKSCDKLLKLYSPEKRLEQSEKAVCDLEKRLSQIMERRLEKLSVKLDGYVSSLNILSPFNILGRGYAIVQKDESVVDSVSMLNVGDEVDIKLSDGSVSANITFVK